MPAEAPRPPCGRTRRMPPRGHLKSRAAAFKGTAGAGRVLCTVRRRGHGHATPQARRRRSRGDRRRRGPEGHEGRVGAGRPEAQRQDTGGHGATRARARAPRPRRHTKMSAGEKINPCVAAAALPLRSSLLSRPRVPRRRRRRRQRRGRRFFLKRPHQTLGSAPLQAGRAKGPGARLPGRPGRPGGGFATAAPGLRPDIPL